uniref:Uncharacterized protein n=1 Tax=Stomoxys calcitrans TaxID=35570 RepID=A0A1I8PAF7_STOCA
MEEEPSFEDLPVPIRTNLFTFPNDHSLRLVHEVYKPSAEALKVSRGRTIYSEMFIENEKLGTLADLSIRCLAHNYGPDPLPMIAEEPLKEQLHYDSLDVDLPLAKCYHLENERFWKRVVLSKHPDKALSLRSNVNWKQLGISMKYTEMVEECPPEYWKEEEMSELAQKIQEYVVEMYIKRLKSLTESSFEKYYLPRKPQSSDEEDEESVEEVFEASVPTSEEDVPSAAFEDNEMKTESQLQLEQQMAEEKAKRKQVRQLLREEKANARREREERRERRQAKRLAKEQQLENSKKMKKQTQPESLIEISENDSDEEKYILDRRNLELYLKYKKDYKYPPEHCDHIDLSFVRHLKNLHTFNIEFLGPILGRNYHHRHLNFSLGDIKTLAQGLSHLALLKVFRLRHSRMDADKLQTLVRGLKGLHQLETVDFGYDNLGEDCASSLYELLEDATSIRNLELESNQLGEEVLMTLGESLQQHYVNGHLEYLGLARNPITEQGLHALVNHILGTSHIKSLNLRGVYNLYENGLICCIARELLLHHKPLEKLDLTGIPININAANELIKALALNQKLLTFECLGCGLDEESQLDIALIMKRNKYLADNPYVDDLTKTDAEVDEWLNRTTNPIFSKVLAERSKLLKCQAECPPEYIPSPQQSPKNSQHIYKLEIYDNMYEQSHTSSQTEIETQTDQGEQFSYRANEFDDKEFLENIHLPGPSNRYFYFKSLREN